MNPWPIAPITDQDLNFAVVSYDFASFTNNEETDLPSLESSIDTSLLDYAGSIADQTTLIASLFSGLDDVFTVLNELGSDDLESLFGPLSNAASSSDLILTNYQGLLGDSAGSGGGGGSVGGGASGGITIGTASQAISPCSVDHPWPAPNTQPLPYSETVTLVNTFSQTIQVTAMNLYQPTAGVFSATTDCTGTVQPNAACHLYLTQNKPANQGDVIQVQITIAGIAQPTVECFTVGGTAPPPSGGGGGGGGVRQPIA